MRKQIFRHGSKRALQLRSARAGFTLIELLVVIAIIGLLSTVAMVALNSTRMKARDARRVGDINKLRSALELYYNSKNGYPVEPSNVVLGATGQKTLSYDNDFSDTAAGVAYMSAVPSNPTPLDGGTIGYVYKTDGTGSAYSIQYYLGASTGGITAGLNTACAAGISGCTATP